MCGSVFTAGVLRENYTGLIKYTQIIPISFINTPNLLDEKISKSFTLGKLSCIIAQLSDRTAGSQ